LAATCSVGSGRGPAGTRWRCDAAGRTAAIGVTAACRRSRCGRPSEHVPKHHHPSAAWSRPPPPRRSRPPPASTSARSAASPVRPPRPVRCSNRRSPPSPASPPRCSASCPSGVSPRRPSRPRAGPRCAPVCPETPSTRGPQRRGDPAGSPFSSRAASSDIHFPAQHHRDAEGQLFQRAPRHAWSGPQPAAGWPALKIPVAAASDRRPSVIQSCSEAWRTRGPVGSRRPWGPTKGLPPQLLRGLGQPRATVSKIACSDVVF
jgi:hypothetical protein